MWFNEETGKWEKFGSAPVSNCYFKAIEKEEDAMLRDILISSSVELKEIPPDEGEAIWIDLSGEDIVVSKGWIDFFTKHFKNNMDSQI